MNLRMKGIIMAGGTGTRLRPLTNIINKHLLNIYDKPMIFYSISLLIYAGVKEILIICNKGDEIFFKNILNAVEFKHKIIIHYQEQTNVGGGIAEGLILSKNFIIKAKKIIFLLGDNFFYGRSFPQQVKHVLKKKTSQSCVFLSEVSNPQDYGVAYLNNNKLIKIIEKPKNVKSNLAVTGLYIYHKNVLKFINSVKPSKRKELEITSINNILLKKGYLDYVRIGRATTWFDLGSFENIYQCAEFVRLIEKRQGQKISDI
jgi:glucose-1-phosphate thymidylyltransferase